MNRTQKPPLRNRRNSDSSMPRTKSAVYLPKLNSLRSKAKTYTLQNVGKRTLFAHDGRVRATLPNPPTFKMVPIVKKVIDAEEPEPFYVNASVLIRQFVNGKQRSTSASSLMFRDSRFMAQLAIEDGFFVVSKNEKERKGSIKFLTRTSRSESKRLRKNSKSRRLRGDTQVESQMSECERPSRESEFGLTRLISIKMNKSKKDQFSLIFYSRNTKTEEKEEDNWKVVPSITQISVKCENSLHVENILNALLDQISFVVSYNEALIQQFRSNVKAGRTKKESAEGMLLTRNIEKMVRINLDLKVLLYGMSPKLSDDFANFAIHLSNNGDELDEAGFWKDRAMMVKTVVQISDGSLLAQTQKKHAVNKH